MPDVAALERTLERVPGQIVLVGHAYAGAVIGAAGNERVKTLVYVTALAPEAFAPNATAEQQALLTAVQRPISPACITVPMNRPRWRDLPSWFLVAEQDYMILPETQRFMAQRMGARVRAHEVDHTPIVTAPTVVVDIIREAIAEVRKGVRT
jgi:hypothetical protein